MTPLGTILGLPVVLPIAGLGWLARQVAEAVEKEYADPARIQSALYALEAALEAGEIDDAAYELQEAELLAWLESLRPENSESEAEAAMQAEVDALETTSDKEPAAPGASP